ncbi:RHS repeat domain-containing protein, partial [Aquimarina atlantica]|uniref:RHS repeat domain-containing protein n=1 Tax=Aquimarina atlantica TaxID=1317122 RepID=UPI000558E048
ELDPETGKEAFQLRLWDARIGRWLTTDPYGQYASPYLGMGNNPMNLVDPDGGSTASPDNKYKLVWNDDTQSYDEHLIDKTGGDFYDIIEYEGGDLDGVTDLFINPYIKESFNFIGENDLILDATIHRVGPGEWAYRSDAITPLSEANYLPIPPILKAFKYSKFWKNSAKGFAGVAFKNTYLGIGYKSLKGISLRHVDKFGRTFGLDFHQLAKKGAFRFHGHYAQSGISKVSKHIDVVKFMKEVGRPGLKRLLKGPIDKHAGGIDKVIRRALNNTIKP